MMIPRRLQLLRSLHLSLLLWCLLFFLFGTTKADPLLQEQQKHQQEGFFQGVIDETLLPEGTTVQEVERIFQSVLSSTLQKQLELELELDQQRHDRERNLFANTYWNMADDNPCNEVLATIGKVQLRQKFNQLVEKFQLVPNELLTLMDMAFVATMHYDVRVWKLCGRCSDFVLTDQAAGEQSQQVACQPTDYGYDALMSGLLIAPYNQQEDKLLETTLPVNIITPAGGSVPSRFLWGEETNDIQHLSALYVTSTTRAYTVMMDYIGEGESTDYYKGFLLRQVAITSTLPLIWQAEDIVREVSNCHAALADSYSVLGYSEGAYAAVAIADALSKMGKDIIMVHAGGGPYRISTTTILDTMDKISNGKGNWYGITFFIARLGLGFSSTNTDMANYGMGQDFLGGGDSVTDLKLRAAAQGTDGIYRGDIFKLIPRDNPLSVFNPNLVQLYQQALEAGNKEPCQTWGRDDVGKTDKICQALMDQDLVTALEEAQYPVMLCHDTTDTVVPYENLPDIRRNPNNLRLMNITLGLGHLYTGIPCFMSAFVWYTIPIHVMTYPVTPRTTTSINGCVKRGQTPKKKCNSFLLQLLGNPFGMC